MNWGDEPIGQGRPAPCGRRAGRFELIRALGSLTLEVGRTGSGPAEVLPEAALDPVEHTRLFVLELPPFASIYLGPEGQLGGVGADRVAGLWRALRLDPPAEPDHLGYLLGFYAELGEAAEEGAGLTRARLENARRTLLFEHILSWIPVYTMAIEQDSSYGPAAQEWGRLLVDAMTAEVVETSPPDRLPLALRSAPSVDHEFDRGELLNIATTPIRSGFILTRSALSHLAGQAGLGVRHGERRFALGAMMDQDPVKTLTALSRYARHWSSRLATRPVIEAIEPVVRWWSDRALATAELLAGRASPTVD